MERRLVTTLGEDMFSLIINLTPQTGRPKFARQLIMANTLIYSSTLYYNKKS